ncbi:hypothetical protein [Algoriphagus sediminis]|uniref:Uncharacterized protein n=1 Tax=Algoriphagus sediminis TaxID=3057113 RepID=A0ABT7YDZ0_9BACT|nr:hypothetical protein [Algoriphagus sediminis]MDN3204702.1 hypothetical protein [Algoriphagus sediminis]
MKEEEFFQMTKICLLLTSTINPRDYEFVGRKGIVNRENDYLKAVRFYKTFGFPIIYIDNSDYVSEQIQSQISQIPNSQYLAFDSLESFRGKGHGELEILKYAFDNSEFLCLCDYFIKISGRYIVTNFADFISKVDFSINHHFCNLSRNMNWADSRIVIFERSFFQKFFVPTLEKYLDEENGEFFEKSYARSIHLFQYSGGKISYWPVYPFYSGINGENGKLISFKFFKRMKYTIYLKLKKYISKQTI